MLIYLVLYLVISYIMFEVHGRISVLNDLFVQLDSYSFVMCHVEIFEQLKMDGWMELSCWFETLLYCSKNCDFCTSHSSLVSKCLHRTAPSYLSRFVHSGVSNDHSLLLRSSSCSDSDNTALLTVLLQTTQPHCLWSCSLELSTSSHSRLIFIIILFLQPSQSELLNRAHGVNTP